MRDKWWRKDSWPDCALGNKIGRSGRKDGGFGSWPLLLPSPQRRLGYPRRLGKWLNRFLASQPIHMLSESSLAPSGRGCLRCDFVWGNLTHSQMNHGHLSSARLPPAHTAPAVSTLQPHFRLCYTPRFRLVLQWFKPRISTTSFAGEVGFWLFCSGVLFPLIVT